MNIDSNEELVEDMITFFQKLGASNELSNRNFDTEEFLSLDYCNYIYDLAKKYELYDETEDAKNVNYIVNLEDELTLYFKNILLKTFNIKN